jgi:uncharacterized protein (TIGR02145 family)
MKIKLNVKLPFVIALIFLLGNCKNSGKQNANSDTQSGKATDEGTIKKYRDTVSIGHQIWTSINLSVDTFRNGESIFEAKSIDEFKKAGQERKSAWCYYNNDSSNEVKYGKLYNWYAINDARGLAPKGWHIPEISEWDTLTNYLGGENICGKKLRNTSGWYTNGNGDNSSGFSALPGGCFTDYEFASIGELGYWWASTKAYEDAAYARYLNYNYDPLKFAGFSSSAGFSVRCVKD